MTARSGSENRRRDFQVGVRLLPEEYKALAAEAARDDVTMGEALRRARFGPVKGDTIDGYCGFCGREGHAAVDCTALSPTEEAEFRRRVRQAVLDPGSFVARGPDNDGYARGEDLGRWQDRALQVALREPDKR